jgi:hypothetical protein
LKKLNVRKLIADLGGVPAIAAGLESIGVDVRPKTIEKWRERSSLSMNRWLELVEMVRRTERRTLVIDDYLTTTRRT